MYICGWLVLQPLVMLALSTQANPSSQSQNSAEGIIMARALRSTVVRHLVSTRLIIHVTLGLCPRCSTQWAVAVCADEDAISDAGCVSLTRLDQPTGPVHVHYLPNLPQAS